MLQFPTLLGQDNIYFFTHFAKIYCYLKLPWKSRAPSTSNQNIFQGPPHTKPVTFDTGFSMKIINLFGLVYFTLRTAADMTHNMDDENGVGLMPPMGPVVYLSEPIAHEVHSTDLMMEIPAPIFCKINTNTKACLKRVSKSTKLC